MAGELILVVEDNDKNRKLVRDILEFKGYRIIEVTTAEEGLEIACVQHPALILMDIHLPGMDGITAFKHLKADPRTSKIPVIAVTASAMPNEREVIEAAGFEGYQSKPISVNKLTAEVGRIIDAHPTPHMTD